MAQKEFTAATSSTSYEVRLTVDYSDSTPTSASQTATLQMWIRHLGVYNRYRHTWGIDYIIDGGARGAQWYTLPDDSAAAGVVSAGKLTMADRQWYKWGPAHYVTVANDGGNHTFGCTFACVGTIPREGGVSGTIYFPKYTAPAPPPSTPTAIIPQTPQDVRTTFDEKARALKYYIGDTASANYFTLWRNWFNEEGNLVKEGYLHQHIVYSDIPLTETIPDNVVKVTYQVTAYSVTGNTATTGHMETLLPTDPKVCVKVNGEWKKTIPYVKVNGEWKKAIPHVKVNGEWKKTVT